MNPPPEEILILNDYASANGGSSGVAIASAVRLARQGWHVTYFSCVGPVAPALRDQAGLDVICLDQPEIATDPRRLRAFVSGLRNRHAVAALRTLLATRDARRTVVHAHTWMKALSPFALHAVTAAGFPLVVTLHDFFITCPTGGFFDHRRNRLCRRRPLSAACLACNCDRRNYGHKLWRSARTFLQNHWLGVPENTAHYIAVSRFSAAVMRPYLPPATPVSVVANPVDSVDEGPAPVAGNRGFLFVGRLVPEKGVRLLLAAVRATGLPATFVGDGELLAEARQRCPQARFTGWLDAAGIRMEMRRARGLVFPPLWYETLGLVTIEAAAAGLPVIVSDQCAATDHVRHGETGLHFPHGSAAGLAAAMRRLARDDALAARLGRQAYDWYWHQPWTAERHTAHLTKIYRSLLPAPDIHRIKMS
jgi:glycosyltransferase involved in cell wall biosynthesis